MSEALSTSFFDCCKYIGQNQAYVQGAGGNISLKVSDRVMWIKSSGVLLDSVEKQSGYTLVDFSTIHNGLMNCECEEAYTALVQGATDLENSFGRASMETGFHACLDKAVIHTHSVYANVYLCTKQGPSLLRDLFPEAIIIDYECPGLELSKAICESYQKQPSCQLFFLKSHGIVVSAASIEEAQCIHESVNQRLKQELGMDSYPPLSLRAEGDYFIGDSEILSQFIDREGSTSVSNAIIMPDQAIYFYSKTLSCENGERVYRDASYEKAMSMESLCLSYYMIQDQIKTQSWDPVYLELLAIQTLLGMSSEKYRIRRIEE